MYKRILIAVDGSPLSNRGLEKGLELAAGLGAEVDILNVCEPWAVGMYDAMGWSAGYEASDEYKQDREDAAQKILQPALAAATAAGVHFLARETAALGTRWRDLDVPRAPDLTSLVELVERW